MCDQIELLTDEYFHGELSPEDKKVLEEHLKICEKCTEFFESEKIYFENIKSAEFVPETNIADSVMNIIISEQRTVDKPAKKRFVPFGLISAAAIVLVIFIASRDTLDLFKNTTNDSAESIQIEENVQDIILNGDFAENNINENDVDKHSGEADTFAIPQIRAMMADDIEVEAEAGDIAPVAEVPAPAAAASALTIEATATIPEPSEIIKIQRSETDAFDFTEFIFLGKSIFIKKEYKDALIENLKIYEISFEIENTGMESEYIEIIYTD